MKFEQGAVCECAFCHKIGESERGQDVPEERLVMILCKRCAIGIALAVFDTTNPPDSIATMYQMLLELVFDLPDLSAGPALGLVLFS